jgi:hypothetical protein
MGEKLVIGPINKGLVNNRTAFNIDNDAFPTLINAYQWRGRVKRKRGTSLLGRLTRYFNSTSTAYSSTSSIALSSGAANILTGFSLQSGGSIVPGSVTIANVTVAQTYTDNSLGVLTGNLGGTGTINYASGAITISGGAGNSITAIFRYYPNLPVMGLEDFNITTSAYPGCIAFDTVYSYNINVTSPYSIYDVSFYKNPVSATYAGYTAKTTVTPTTWNGQNYQQFWTTNYQGALWTTNGITVPFVSTNIGMQYKAITVVDNITAGPPAFADLTIASHGLVVGDFVFINEVLTTTGINFQTGYVTAVVNANKVTVEFPNATLANAGTGGIAQYLTNRSDATKDCLRWYDGDPTDGNATTPTLNGNLGWVNFAPPLSQLSYSIADLPAGVYYLVGARMVVPFKDRILFLGPVIQTSTAGSQVYLQDTIIYSQNGTPYYTCSFPYSTVTPAAGIATNPILVPTRQTATYSSYWEDQTGFGGFFSAGLDQPINTVSSNEDVLIIGFTTIQTRLVYTGNDLIPFNLYLINSELGSSSTFSALNLDKGVISRGSRGFVITAQTGTQRIDLPIPDEVFRVTLSNNGAERMCAQRDFINEWIYFTFPANYTSYIFPNQTLMYNYRDDSWALFRECFTTYGLFRRATGFTWGTIGSVYPTWGTWNEAWGDGDSTLLNPEVIGGNQQGFVLARDEGTNEGNSLYISNISGTTITSPNHTLNNGDFIIITGCIGVSNINGLIWQVSAASTNSFNIESDSADPSGTYLGGGLIKRMYIPFIQTKQFPLAWDSARKTRLGPQQYLFSTTANSQITLLIYLSQNATDPYNNGNIVPEPGSENNSLIYSTVLYTCPESTNLGLTPANINLNLITASQQAQTWHRMNTSLLGDTVQIGFTLSESQMIDVDDNGTPVNAFSEIEFHSAILDVQPSQILC